MLSFNTSFRILMRAVSDENDSKRTTIDLVDLGFEGRNGPMSSKMTSDVLM